MVGQGPYLCVVRELRWGAGEPDAYCTVVALFTTS